MGIGSNKLNLFRMTDYIPIQAFSGLVPQFRVQSAGTVGASMEVGLSADTDAATFEGQGGITGERVLQLTAPNRMASAEDPAVYLKEIATSGAVGLLVATANDSIRHQMPIPRYWDRKQPINARVWWNSEAAAVGDRDITFGISLTHIADNGSTTLATALPTAVTWDAVAPKGVTTTPQKTAMEEIIAGNVIAAADTMLYFSLSMTAFDAAFTEAKYIVGLEFEYTPRWSPYPSGGEAPAFVSEGA
jgi:hypothetical protein